MNFVAKLRSVLDAAMEEDTFRVDKFFRLWFDELGSTYFFLFKKNLKVTNIQLAELTSLVSTYARDREADKLKRHIQFLSTKDFKAAVKDIFTESFQYRRSNAERISLLVDLYQELLSRMVVLDVMHGSAAVFVPPSLSLDIAKICFLSGYIHSCGRTVFIRQIDKVTINYVASSLERALRRFPSESGKPIFMSAYSHEDFTDYDRHDASDLKHGLDEVKIFIEKFYIEDRRLPEVLTELHSRHSGAIYVPPPGDFRSSQIRLRELSDEVDPDRSFWIIIDAPVESDGSKEGRHFLVGYDQLYRNHDPFQIFDENKPGWIAHTTIPHSLMRAMLNVTLPWREGEVRITDPFVGTGTTWFEALKFREVNVPCSDKEPLAKILVEDNWKFFGFSVSELEIVERKLAKIAERPSGDTYELPLFDEDQNLFTPEAFRWMQEMVQSLLGSNSAAESGSMSTGVEAEEIAKLSFDRRLVLYLGLRAQLRYSGAISRHRTDQRTAIAVEAKRLRQQVKRLKDWRRAMESAEPVDEENYALLPGDYSKDVSIRLDRIIDANPGDIRIQDCRQLRPDSFDIIIADPPYGFNTSDSEATLATLYKEMIGVFIKALRDDGQLIICLPQNAFTGKRLPTCTRPDIVTHHVLIEAEKNSRQVVKIGQAMPSHGELFRPPYYWRSEKALSRSILRFRIRDKQDQDGSIK